MIISIDQFKLLIYKVIFKKSLKEVLLLKKRVLVILCHGGDFAACTFDNLEPTEDHKCFSKYITRKKQGKRQSNKDKESRPSSAGSNLRRRNEEMFNEQVKKFLNGWKENIENSELIFIHAPGHNKDLLIKDTPIEKEISKLRTIPFTTGSPTFGETKDIFHKLISFTLK